MKEALIVSSEDGSLWACHPENFCPRAYLANITVEDGSEKETFVNEAENLAYIGKTLKKPEAGFRINHQKYMIVRALERGTQDDGLKTIYFKRPSGGGCLCVTNKAIIIGTFDESVGQSSPLCVSQIYYFC